LRDGARKGADAPMVHEGIDLARRAENGGNLGRAILVLKPEIEVVSHR